MKKGLNPQDQVLFKRYMKEKLSASDISRLLKVDLKVIKKWMRAAAKKSDVKTEGREKKPEGGEKKPVSETGSSKKE